MTYKVLVDFYIFILISRSNWHTNKGETYHGYNLKTVLDEEHQLAQHLNPSSKTKKHMYVFAGESLFVNLWTPKIDNIKFEKI